MVEINNPFVSIEGYNCFGCAPQNPHGLKMNFFEDGDSVISFWEPGDQHQGYDNILHGGIQASLMDELGAWVVFIKLRTAGVTIGMQVDYKKSLFTNRGVLTVRGKVASQDRKSAIIAVEICNGSGSVCAEASITYRLFPEHLARKKLYFPGCEAFYGSNSSEG